MTTAREQAREAVANEWCRQDDGLVTDDLADAASDVWEPIVDKCKTAFILAYDDLIKIKGCHGDAIREAMKAVWAGSR